MLQELLAHPGVTEESRLRSSRLGVMALHGGLEQGTATIAREVASGAEVSLYVLCQPPDLAWHVPSISCDPGHSRRLRRFLDHVELVISLHGFGRSDLRRSILVGGSSRLLRSRLAGRLRTQTGLSVVDDLDAIPRGLRGLHERNPVNLPRMGGAQLELSRAARDGYHRPRVVAAIVEVAMELTERRGTV